MPTFRLFAVPSTFWDDRPRATPPTDDELLREQLREAKAIRERIERGVNLESERGRFTDIVSRIEATLLRRAVAWPPGTVRDKWDASEVRQEVAMMRFPSLQLGDEYLHLLAMVESLRVKARTPGITEPADPLALGGSIFRADQLASHLKSASDEIGKLAASNRLPAAVESAAKARTDFYSTVHEVSGLGIIEVEIVQDNGKLIEATSLPPNAESSILGGQTSESSESDRVEPEREVQQDKPRRKQMVERLHAEVQAAIEVFEKDGRGGKVNASNQPHEVTTDVFGEWVKQPGSPAPVRVRIVYADGSEAAPFPLRCLAGRERPAGQPRVIRVALMSMRHLDIDRIVDLAWYRNREVSQSRSLGESDEFCFRYSIAELRKLAALSTDIAKPIRLEVFHTGFEPASVGLYRAVAGVLSGDDAFQAGWAKALKPWLIVSPMYYKGGTNYEPSKDRNGQVIEWF